MLTPSNDPKLVRAVVKDLNTIQASIRQTCESVGVDVAAADRAADLHTDRDYATLPWRVLPKDFARNAREVLLNDIPTDADISESMRILTEEVMISGLPQWGYLHIALTADHDKWSTASRNAAISLCNSDPMENFEVALYSPLAEDARRDECEALKAWLVYNILAVEGLEKHPLSQNCKEILDHSLLHEVGRLAELYSQHLQTGEMADSHPLRGIDTLLMNLAMKKPELGARVTELLEVWEDSLKGTGPSSRLFFDDALLQLLPDVESVPSLDGETIGREARESFKDYMSNIELAAKFKSLIDQPEWGNPFESVRELVSAEVHKLNIYPGVELFSEQTMAVIHRLLDGMTERPPVIFPSSALGLASADSASIENILDGLREYVATGRKSFAEHAGVSSMNQRQLQDVIATLDLMRDLVGPSNIHLVTDSDLEGFLESGKVKSGILVGVGVDLDEIPTITINLTVNDDPNEKIAKETREILENPAPAIPRYIAGTVRRGVSQFVVPSLAGTHGGADQEGFVGVKLSTMLSIAEQKGLIAPLPRESVGIPCVLQVLKVRDSDDHQALDPVDVEDDSLTPTL